MALASVLVAVHQIYSFANDTGVVSVGRGFPTMAEHRELVEKVDKVAESVKSIPLEMKLQAAELRQEFYAKASEQTEMMRQVLDLAKGSGGRRR